MFGTIRKHSSWLWLVIITATIISFVWWGAKTQRSGGSYQGVQLGRINGKPITGEQYRNALAGVRLQFYMRNGDWPSAKAAQSGFDVQRETYFRLFFNEKIEELGIHVSSESVAQAASQILRSLNQGNPLSLSHFEERFLRPEGLDKADFERFVRFELSLQQLLNLAGVAGRLVPPREAEEIYARETEERKVRAVFFSFSNHVSEVNITPEGLGTFFTNQMSSYRIPERVQVSYVKYEVTNFLAEAVAEINQNTNLAEVLDMVFEQRGGTNYYTEAKSPEEGKEMLLKEEQHNLALRKARREANDFATVLFDIEPRQPDNIQLVAATNDLTVAVTEPFTRDEPPPGLDVDLSFCQSAFALSTNEPFSAPINGKDAVYVIALKDRLPSELPVLEDIRERVEEDYRHYQAATQARLQGSILRGSLTNEMAAGKSFEAACTNASLELITPDPISPATRTMPEIESRVPLQQFKQVVFTTEVGEVSQFVPTYDGGFIVYVAEKLPLDQAKMTEEMPAFMNLLRQNRQSEAFNAWFGMEASRALRETPVMQQPQTAPQG